MKRKYNNQRKVLTHLSNLSPYQPFVSHSGLIFIRWLLENSGQDKDFKGLTEEQIRQSLYHLEKKQLLKKTKEKGGEIKIQFTEKGRKYIEGDSLSEDLTIKHSKKWDGKWWFVMFDIPEKNKYMREIFRDKLKNLGFFRIQRSVWVYPYNCEKEIDSLSQFLDLQNFVLLFHGEMREDAVLRRYFKGGGIKL